MRTNKLNKFIHALRVWSLDVESARVDAEAEPARHCTNDLGLQPTSVGMYTTSRSVVVGPQRQHQGCGERTGIYVGSCCPAWHGPGQSQGTAKDTRTSRQARTQLAGQQPQSHKHRVREHGQ